VWGAKVTGLDQHIGRDLLITTQYSMMMSSAILYNLHMAVLPNCVLLGAKERNVFLDSTKFRSAQNTRLHRELPEPFYVLVT